MRSEDAEAEELHDKAKNKGAGFKARPLCNPRPKEPEAKLERRVRF